MFFGKDKKTLRKVNFTLGENRKRGFFGKMSDEQKREESEKEIRAKTCDKCEEVLAAILEKIVQSCKIKLLMSLS